MQPELTQRIYRTTTRTYHETGIGTEGETGDQREIAIVAVLPLPRVAGVGALIVGPSSHFRESTERDRHPNALTA